MSIKRTFVAIEFSEEVICAIQQFNATLRETLKKQALDAALRFVAPQNSHLTLRFLGDTLPSQIQTIQHELQQVAQSHRSFDLQLGGLGCFPTLRKPTVLWTAPNGESVLLANLQRDVEAVVQKAGFAAESRPFQPHITLARVERNATTSSVRQVGAWVEQMRNKETVAAWSVALHIQQISFVESKLTPAGSLYSLLGRYPLAQS